MYLIEEGKLVAIKNIEGEHKEALDYSPGDYFGEIALLKVVPQKASIKAKTKCTLLSISKDVFDCLIGTEDPQIL
jgi:CRP-like cAMP-binding protein